MGAPAGATYEGHSDGIIGTLQDLFEKAEAQLEEARKTETKSLQAFQMLEQSLKDEIKYGTKDLNKAKKNLGASAEAQATAEGDLAVTTKDLDEDVSTLSTLHQDCMTGASDFEAETKSRGEELTALATAKKVIVEATSGAQDLSYSFVQTSMSSGADLANFEAVRVVRDLAQRQQSAALAQLATRMEAVMRAGGRSNEDIFAKVKDLIRNMIEKLNKEAEADATEKAYCDKEMAETEQKQTEKEAVATLQKELAETAKAQAEMDKIRAEEKGAYD